MFYVNVYELDRRYGGPEEGGWYYDVGFPISSHPCMLESSANHTFEYLSAKYADKGYRYSIMARGTDYLVKIEDNPGRTFPVERPIYE